MSDCCVKKRRGLALWAGVAVATAVGAVLFLERGEAPSDAPPPRSHSPFTLLQRPAAAPALGDVEHGRRFYSLNCAACHGLEADGRGPGARVLRPAPRNHRDAAYMLSRGDDVLFKSIALGGPAVSRSRLMPAWSDVLDKFQIWNLVAYMRSLTPALPEGVARATYHQVLLSEERHARLKTPHLPRFQSFLRCLAPPTDEGVEDLKYFLSFAPLELGRGKTTTLTLLYATDGRLLHARTLHQIEAAGAPPDAVDLYLDQLVRCDTPEPLPGEPGISPYLSALVEGSRILMKLTIEQETEDAALAKDVYLRFGERPQSFPAGERLYIQNCAACHGVTGRVVGPLIVERDAWPRYLADPAGMSALTDDYLRSLVRAGGLHWNLSGAMPAYPHLKEEEVQALIAHVRALAEPQKPERCRCGATDVGCGAKRDERGCRCLEGQAATHLCSGGKK